MIVFPNCKINLGLHILNKREDGFHDVETIFYPVPLQDALEVIQSPDADAPEARCSVSGTKAIINEKDNICLKAYHLLKRNYPLPPVMMHLHKAIPIGAGLGGGSSDGAFTLLLLNKKFHLGLTENELVHYAAQLGSDCTFFIKNKPSFARGRGELLEEINIDLSGYKIIVVNPQIHVSTRWAYAHTKPDNNRPSVRQIIDLPLSDWSKVLINDFEEPIFQHHPEIRIIKETMYQQGALYAAMTGSGSTVYGFFEKTHTPDFKFPLHYYIKEVS